MARDDTTTWHDLGDLTPAGLLAVLDGYDGGGVIGYCRSHGTGVIGFCRSHGVGGNCRSHSDGNGGRCRSSATPPGNAGHCRIA